MIPNAFYSNVLNIINKYKLSLEELSESSVNMVYKRVICDMNHTMCNFKSFRIVSKVLPSYLNSFNYRLHFNFLPLKSLFRDWQLDNDSCCYFCNVGPETTYHLFGTCEKLKGLWMILKEAHFYLCAERFDYEHKRRNFKIDLTNVPCNKTYEKTLIYLNSIANYSIWRHRNEMRYEFKNFNLEVLARKMIRSIRARKSAESHMSDSHKVPFLSQLCDGLVVAVNHYPFDNG